MRKKICLTILMIICLITFNNKVDAKAVMYINCKIDIYNPGWIPNIPDENVIFFIATRSFGDSTIMSANVTNVNRDYLELNSDGCWINEKSKINEKCSNTNAIMNIEQAVTNLQNGCPAAIRKEWTFDSEFVPAGISKPLEMSILTENEWVIYNYYSEKEKKDVTIIEGYFNDGKYAYINVNVDESSDESPDTLQRYSILGEHTKSNGPDFWKVSNNYNTLYPFIDDNCESLEECKKEHNFKIIENSKGDYGLIKESAKEWYNAEKDSYKKLSSGLTKITEDKSFIDECDKISEAADKKEKYSFPSNYSNSNRDNFIKKLEESLEAMKNAEKIQFTDYVTCPEEEKNEKITPMSSAISYFWVKKLNSCSGDTKALITRPDDKDYYLNPTLIHSMISTSLEKEIKNISESDEDKIDILNLDDTLNHYSKLFLTATTYLKAYYDELGFTDEQLERIKVLLSEYQNYAGERGIYVVLDCEGLLGEDLINKINSYLNIIKIAIPIILIVLGIIDFTKAVFASDAELMNKAKKDFAKRIAIAILIFLVPTILNLILGLANKVWNIIEPSGCGIK